MNGWFPGLRRNEQHLRQELQRRRAWKGALREAPSFVLLREIRQRDEGNIRKLPRFGENIQVSEGGDGMFHQGRTKPLIADITGKEQAVASQRFSANRLGRGFGKVAENSTFSLLLVDYVAIGVTKCLKLRLLIWHESGREQATALSPFSFSKKGYRILM